MASSRKKAETKGTAVTRAGKGASSGAKAAGRKVAAPATSAAKKKQKAAGGTKAVAERPSPPLPAKRAAAMTATPAPTPTPAASAKRASSTAIKSALAKAGASARPKAAAVRPAKAARVAPAAAKTPKTAARRGAAPVAAAPKARAARTAVTVEPAEGRPAVRGRGVASGGKRLPKASPAGAPHAVDGLSEEDQIRAAKYLPRELPKRIFEEERFIFPETYGVNRVRLLVRDPEWIFAYWDVSPAAMKDFARSIGERALALSRLTLRVIDPVSGGSTDILLPPGARWWYVRTDQARRTYRAELGVTLPSGEFRRLAESNTVVTPRVGPSPERARRRLSYVEARELPPSAAAAASEAEKRDGVAKEPWAPGAVEGAETPGAAGAGGTRAGAAAGAKGGASDTFRPGGASDAFPGASDTFRR